MKKILLAAGAIALLAAGCGSQTANQPQTPEASINPAPRSVTTDPMAKPGQQTQGKMADDTSNAALDASLSNVDASMTSLKNDSANVDASLGEQQAP